MAKNTPPGHPNIFPALKYKDGEAALGWLTQAFGFTRQAAYPNPDGSLAHAQMTYGAGMIMLGSGGKPDPKNPWSSEPLGVYVQVEDIDAHYAKAKAAGAVIVRELADTGYGAREYSARDLDGHLWSFGTYDPWKTD
ncbi:VOC family protein [Hypericibacter sp.]|uniref:VOC family protein n=1 Tax=Hypericibacter sp. TaxID=2705401 RepID=UPI003D6C8CA8